MPAARKKFVVDRGRKWRRQFSRHAGPFEKREQIRGPEFVNFTLAIVRVPSSWATRRPVDASTRTSRCTSQVAIGEMPGMNQLSVRCGQNEVGNWPETEQNSTRLRFSSGGGRWGSKRAGCSGAQPIDHLKQERSGGGAPDKSRVSFSIKISDPNREHVVIENRDRPCIPESVRGSGFPKDRSGVRRIGISQAGPRDLPEHVEREKGCFGTDQADTRFCLPGH